MKNIKIEDKILTSEEKDLLGPASASSNQSLRLSWVLLFKLFVVAIRTTH